MNNNIEAAAPKGRHHNRWITLLTAITGGLLVAALWRFNSIAIGYEYYILGNLMALFFAPMLMIMFVFREEPSEYGFGLGQSKRVIWITAALFVGLLVILVPASRLGDFQNSYPIFKGFAFFQNGGPFTEGDIPALVYGWASYGLYMFCWEFFFRGYLLFGLARTIKWPAVIVQAIPFMLLHYGKPPSEVIMSFPAGIILGMLALRAKSFVPGFVLHWAASITFDILVMVSGPTHH